MITDAKSVAAAPDAHSLAPCPSLVSDSSLSPCRSLMNSLSAAVRMRGESDAGAEGQGREGREGKERKGGRQGRRGKGKSSKWIQAFVRRSVLFSLPFLPSLSLSPSLIIQDHRLLLLLCIIIGSRVHAVSCVRVCLRERERE